MTAPEPVDRILARARLHFDRQGWREALRAGHEALALDPEHGEALLICGHSALQLDDLAAARQLSSTLLGIAPDWPPAHLLGGLVASTADRDAVRAEQLFRSAIRLAPEWPAPYATLGLFLGWRRRCEEGITVARRGLKLDPENVEVLTALQSLYRLNGEKELADRYGEMALAVDPEHADLHLEAGLRLLESGQSRRARSRFLDALRLDPEDAEGKDLIASERVRTHPLFRGGYFLSFRPSILVPALLVPVVWWLLSRLLSPLVYLAWASAIVVTGLYVYHGLFRLCRWHVRRRIDRGQL